MNEVKPQTRMQRIGYREPTDGAEPEQPVLVEGILAFNEEPGAGVCGSGLLIALSK